MYASYDGPLYQVTRGADNATADVPPLAAGGVSNSTAQDAFCSSSPCTITTIYDQSPMGNHLYLGIGGGAAPAPDKGVDANAARITVGGHAVYGARFEGGQGYRTNGTRGVATGDSPETIYMVVSGSHYNGLCCFDYGNAEVDAIDHGKGTMESVYWGNSSGWGRGAGPGPWVMADIENGLWAGDTEVNDDYPSVTGLDYVVGMVKGNGGKGFTLKAGDATTSYLPVMYKGPRPPSYNPMKLQGALILGTGGDNSNRAVGTWFEGCVTANVTPDAADDAVMKDIAGMQYS